ncbi:hypothetical protein ACFSSC_10070 [Corynebacterium mendelii]|uniref:Uncharacterized protein n=1 Tax=Corynebacterium mendelii TaxID=2765362 RepID=A0A939E0X2_9CORY|nr:hypothetical protein [Corynebacterium mendelii]MBN9644411.1 hypothetical protein [Corynebacterium mendelii]
MTSDVKCNNKQSSAAALRWVEEQIAADRVLTEPEICQATGESPEKVDNMMRFLNLLGHTVKDPEGPTRGPEVRWMKKPGS